MVCKDFLNVNSKSYCSWSSVSVNQSSVFIRSDQIFFILAIQCAHEKRDILMIVDGSASVGRDNIKEVKKFLQRLAAKLHVGKHNNHLALVQFSEAAKTHAHFGLDQYYDPKKIGQVIDTMEYHAGLRTMTGYALALANQKV